MTKEEAEHYAEVVLRVLGDRPGFETWWDRLDPAIQEGIRQQLANELQSNPL